MKLLWSGLSERRMSDEEDVRQGGCPTRRMSDEEDVRQGGCPTRKMVTRKQEDGVVGGGQCASCVDVTALAEEMRPMDTEILMKA